MKRISAITTANVLEIADADPTSIVEFVQDIVADHAREIPSECITREGVLTCQALQSYYANEHAFIVGLWGMVRIFAGTDKRRIAVRDYLEAAASTCKLRYAAASRQLAGLQTLQGDAAMFGAEV